MNEQEAIEQDVVEFPMTYFKLNEERRNVIDQIIDKLYESQNKEKEENHGREDK